MDAGSAHVLQAWNLNPVRAHDAILRRLDGGFRLVADKPRRDGNTERLQRDPNAGRFGQHNPVKRHAHGQHVGKRLANRTKDRNNGNIWT